ncbi:hypothetical protein [Scytonema millei]|uniref:Uncharacterized protein n=1 Tax=Scytonema millei VB511283 TaxID=1245923 RepID=A0A9X5E5S8_9CYAN|nr:hypothetical protein [Scytonema millei]NHC34542.1 hypothetical protein [Scytonema millei VB511283]
MRERSGAEGARQFTHSRINSEFRIPNSLHYTPHPTPFLHCQPSTVNRQLSTVNCQPSTNNQQFIPLRHRNKKEVI